MGLSYAHARGGSCRAWAPPSGCLQTPATRTGGGISDFGLGLDRDGRANGRLFWRKVNACPGLYFPFLPSLSFFLVCVPPWLKWGNNPHWTSGAQVLKLEIFRVSSTFWMHNNVRSYFYSSALFSIGFTLVFRCIRQNWTELWQNVNWFMLNFIEFSQNLKLFFFRLDYHFIYVGEVL